MDWTDTLDLETEGKGTFILIWLLLFLFQPKEFVAKLKCYLDHRDDPYYYLHPAQVEVAHKNPDILVFHNVVSHKEMEIVRNVAAPLVSSFNWPPGKTYYSCQGLSTVVS